MLVGAGNESDSRLVFGVGLGASSELRLGIGAGSEEDDMGGIV